MALTKVSGGILDPGINVAGIVTATGFSGPFIGGGGVNAGIVTATGLDVNGNGDISGTLVVGNIGGTPTFTGDVNFNGNVSIAQTLTYSDVTNIDSVGIVTARQGIRVTADGSTSANYISVGASNDFKIYHTGTHTHLDNDTGDITVTANQINLNNQDNSENCLQCIGNAEVRLFHNGVNKFQTTSYGAIVDPVSHYNSQSASPARLSLGGSFSNTSAITTKPKLTLWEDSSNNDAMGFQITASLLSVHLSKTSYDFAIKAAGNTLLTVDSGNNETNYSADHDLNLNASTNKSGIIRFNNYAPTAAGPNKIILWESSSPDWSGGFGVSSNHIDYYSGHTHRFYTGTTTSSVGNVAAKFIKDGAAELYHNGSKKLVTASNGIDITGMCTDDGARHDGDVYFIGGTSGRNVVWDMSDNALEFADNAKAVFGTGSDLEIYHTGSGSVIDDVGAGSLHLRRAGSNRINVQTDGVQLCHSGNAKLETTVSGVTVTGTVTADGLAVGDNEYIRAGNSSDIQFYHDANGSIHGTSAVSYIKCQGVHDNILDIFTSTATGKIRLKSNNLAETMLSATGNGAVELYYDNGKKLETNNDGVQVTGSTGSFLNIRTSGSYDSGLVLTVNNNDSTDWSMRNDESDSNKLDFRYDGTRKMHLTSSGDLHLTGEVAASQDYPNFRPTLDFNFAAEKKLDPRITYTRTGPASYYDEFGKVVLVGDNVPRFDHDPTTRECKGLLIEESSTNEWRNSESLTGGTDGYTLPNGLTTPAGGSTAVKITAGANNTWWSAGAGGFSVTSGDYWTMSWWAYSTIQSVDFGNSDYFYVSNTTISQDKTVPAGQWKRCFRTVQFNANGSPQIRFMPYNSTLYTDTNNEVFVWGFQFEKKQFPTSYIPTYGYATTRGDDDLIIDGEDLTDFHNQPEGTIIADYKVIAGDPEIFYLSNNGSSKRIGLYEAGSSQTRFLIGNSGTQADTTDSAGTTVGDNIKAAGAYKLNDVAAAKNGVISSTDTSVTIPDGIDRAYIGGYYDGTVQGVLGLRRLIYYPQRLPNSQLVTLTS